MFCEYTCVVDVYFQRLLLLSTSFEGLRGNLSQTCCSAQHIQITDL